MSVWGLAGSIRWNFPVALVWGYLVYYHQHNLILLVKLSRQIREGSHGAVLFLRTTPRIAGIGSPVNDAGSLASADSTSQFCDLREGDQQTEDEFWSG